MVYYSGACFTTISVYTTSASGVYSDIFEDLAGTIYKSNPFVSFGNYSFYATVGQYVLQGDFTRINPYPAVAFAKLPGTPVVGMQRTITNSTTAVWGAVIAGGGANQVLGWWSGIAWTVIGK